MYPERCVTYVPGPYRWVPNYAVNAPVLASRRLQGKRHAFRPARYRGR